MIESENPRVLIAVLEAAKNRSAARKDALAEIVAWDDLFRFGKGLKDEVVKELTRLDSAMSSKWVSSLQRTTEFVSSNQTTQSAQDSTKGVVSSSADDQWSEPDLNSSLPMSYMNLSGKPKRKLSGAIVDMRTTLFLSCCFGACR